MKHMMRKIKIILAISVLVALAISGIAFAAGTPGWWDNPDGYTSWTQTIASSTISNTGDAALTAVVTMDIKTR